MSCDLAHLTPQLFSSLKHIKKSTCEEAAFQSLWEEAIAEKFQASKVNHDSDLLIHQLGRHPQVVIVFKIKFHAVTHYSVSCN